MKISTAINNLNKIKEEFGDIQVLAFGYRILGPFVYERGIDDFYADFSKE